MTDLNQTILHKVAGETRINPDEQRTYLGTFRERVILLLSFEEATSPQVQAELATICRELANTASPLFLKLSPDLSDSLQIAWMKEAQAHGIQSSIIDERLGHSPYALVFHTDHVLDKEDVSLDSLFPIWKSKISDKQEKKPSFWKRLFG